MLGLIRFGGWFLFYALTVGLPGLLLGKVVAGPRGRVSTLFGVIGVLGVAALLALFFHARLSRPVIALAGLIVGIGSAVVLRRRRGL